MNTKIETYSGKLFDVLNPKPSDVCLIDIAHSLSMQCRFGGHCQRFYSVAQHSVLMCSANLPGDPIMYLFHDAAEAYISDIVSPLKKFLGNLIGKIEDNIMYAIMEAFDIIVMDKELIHKGDMIMLATEKRDLMNDICKWETKLPAPLPNKIIPWTQNTAKEVFFVQAEFLL